MRTLLCLILVLSISVPTMAFRPSNEDGINPNKGNKQLRPPSTKMQKVQAQFPDIVIGQIKQTRKAGNDPDGGWSFNFEITVRNIATFGMPAKDFNLVLSIAKKADNTQVFHGYTMYVTGDDGMYHTNITNNTIRVKGLRAGQSKTFSVSISEFPAPLTTMTPWVFVTADPASGSGVGEVQETNENNNTAKIHIATSGSA